MNLADAQEAAGRHIYRYAGRRRPGAATVVSDSAATRAVGGPYRPRHSAAANRRPVDPNWSPLSPSVREWLAPTYWLGRAMGKAGGAA